MELQTVGSGMSRKGNFLSAGEPRKTCCSFSLLCLVEIGQIGVPRLGFLLGHPRATMIGSTEKLVSITLGRSDLQS